jgi:hypothetical protein
MAPILLFLVAITVLAELAEVAKVFDVAALHSSRLARGRTGLLFLLVALLATVTTVLLGLDTTAVLLTPVVLSMSVHLDLPGNAVRAADRLAGQHREPSSAGLEPHQPARAGPPGAAAARVRCADVASGRGRRGADRRTARAAAPPAAAGALHGACAAAGRGRGAAHRVGAGLPRAGAGAAARRRPRPSW